MKNGYSGNSNNQKNNQFDFNQIIDNLFNNRSWQIRVIAIISAIILFFNSIFTVDQRQYAMILQFGEPIRIIDKPGVNFKIPLMQNIIFFDNRIIDLSLPEQEVIALDQKRLMINAFTKYRIKDPLKFYTTVRNFYGLENKLSAIFDSSLRKIVGSAPLNQLLSDNRGNIMTQIKDDLSSQSAIFGIEISDVRIMRGDLPKENSDAIFARMQSEREKEAKEIRAKGAEEAQKIKAEADKQKTIIIAEANKKANIMRGIGEAESNRIYANSFGKDPEFAEFYRAMQAYRKSFNKENTQMVISPDNDFFKHFNHN